MRHEAARGFRSALVAAGLVAGLGCSATTAALLMAREAEPGSAREVVDPERGFRSALSLPFTPGETDGGTFLLEIEVEGSEVPMYCFILTEETELGVSSLRIADTVFADFAERGLAVSERQILSVGAGVIGEATYQSLAISFDLRDDEGEGGLGTMKTASANKLGHAIACNHWDAGYRATFARAFVELVESFEPDERPPDPYYVEMNGVQVNGLLVGIASMRMVRDADGDVQSTSETSMLIPRAIGEVQATYSKSVDWSRSDGSLINAFDYEEDVEGSVTGLALRRGKDTGWRATGTFERKPLDQELGHDEPLASALSEALGFRHQLRPEGERVQLALDRWIPSADPTRVSEVTIRLDEADHRIATAALGPIEMRVERGEDGLPVRHVMEFGGAQMVLERIHRRGDL